MHDHAIPTPQLRTLARQGLPSILEGSLIPLAVFYLALWTIGMWGALIAALAWSYGAVLRRVVRRERVPGLVVLSALTLTVRTVIAVATESVFIYFLQPTLGTAVMGLAFLVSMAGGQPLLQKLATDFLPVPPEFFSQPRIRRFFLRISLLWAFVMLANAGVTVWMLIELPVSTYLATKTAASMLMMGTAIVWSTVWFRRVVGTRLQSL